jgi:hypothetical protein
MINGVITIMKDDEAELRPASRKDMIARAAVAHRIDKETLGLEDFWRPVFFDQELPLGRAGRRNPDMLLGCLVPVQDSIVAERLEKLACGRKEGTGRNRQGLGTIGARGIHPLYIFHLRGKLFKEEQVVFLG